MSDLIKDWDVLAKVAAETKDTVGTSIKIQQIAAIISENVENWRSSEEMAKAAIDYLSESDLRKSVFLAVVGQADEELVKSDSEDWLPDIAQWADQELIKAQVQHDVTVNEARSPRYEDVSGTDHPETMNFNGNKVMRATDPDNDQPDETDPVTQGKKASHLSKKPNKGDRNLPGGDMNYGNKRNAHGGTPLVRKSDEPVDENHSIAPSMEQEDENETSGEHNTAQGDPAKTKRKGKGRLLADNHIIVDHPDGIDTTGDGSIHPVSKLSKDDTKKGPSYFRAAGRGLLEGAGGAIAAGIAGRNLNPGHARALSAVASLAATFDGRRRSFKNQAKKAGVKDKHILGRSLTSMAGDMVVPFAGGYAGTHAYGGYKKLDQIEGGETLEKAIAARIGAKLASAASHIYGVGNDATQRVRGVADRLNRSGMATKLRVKVKSANANVKNLDGRVAIGTGAGAVVGAQLGAAAVSKKPVTTDAGVKMNPRTPNNG